MKKLLVFLFFAFAAIAVYFLVTKKIDSIEKLKRAAFEATHDRDDVAECPIIMEIPEVPTKYCPIQATDASLNTFNYIGSRFNLTAGKWAYCKFDWQVTLPDGVTRIDCPTNQVFL